MSVRLRYTSLFMFMRLRLPKRSVLLLVAALCLPAEAQRAPVVAWVGDTQVLIGYRASHGNRAADADDVGDGFVGLDRQAAQELHAAVCGGGRSQTGGQQEKE